MLPVDNQAMMGEAAKRALSSERAIRSHFCSSALEAIKVEQSVILQDLVMPDMDRLALGHQYRSNAHTEVV